MSRKKNRTPIEISWENAGPPPELDEAVLSDALRQFLAVLNHSESGLSLLLAGDSTLQRLNWKFRGLNCPTDVLSWVYGEEVSKEEDGTLPLLGELALSLERARVQAHENGWDLSTEVLRLLAHGCAHLAGYDHESDGQEREMKAVEIEMLAQAGLKDIYPPS